ncbi:MAG: SPOR domain-containing protein [Coxiella endosymbiont of Haemaphysalis qinghaiensis]
MVRPSSYNMLLQQQKMTRDYAKKSLSSQRRSGYKLIISILLVLGLPVTVFSFFIYHYHKSKFSRKELSFSSTAAAQAPPLSSISAKLKQPKFEFYTLLPEMEVAAPIPVSQKPFSRRTVLALNHFVLQIASLKNIIDAERLKSQLSTLNFPTCVHTYRSTDGTVWNRVMVGPYLTIQEAKRVQNKLHRPSLLVVYY